MLRGTGGREEAKKKRRKKKKSNRYPRIHTYIYIRTYIHTESRERAIKDIF